MRGWPHPPPAAAGEGLSLLGRRTGVPEQLPAQLQTLSSGARTNMMSSK
jgi:hypothetical protein